MRSAGKFAFRRRAHVTCSLPCSLRVRADLSEQALEAPGEKPEERSQKSPLIPIAKQSYMHDKFKSLITSDSKI